jgi:flavin-dependent dehydrogenase
LVHRRSFPDEVEPVREIAIVGGGPAGAMAGERLARSGFRVALFDEHLAWEKPCGGGLTHKATAAYSFLLDGPHPKKLIYSAELISSRGYRARLELDRPIVIYSRQVLNGLLLERAVAAGCNVIRAHVSSVWTDGPRARLAAGDATHEADFVVLAGGARNRLLPETTPLGAEDLEMTLGYYVPVTEDVLKVKFLPQFEGYLWSFPRPDHLSVGICGKMRQNSSHRLRRRLDDFVREEKIPLAGAEFYSHLLPSPQADTLHTRRIVGRNWALVGDAAACVDPITGEGLYYALRSGDLLAQALAEGQPQSYPARLQAEFASDLELAARLARLVFRGQFLGGAVTTRMVQFARRSPTFRQLLRDVFSGAQDYSSLKQRLWSQLAVTMLEFGSSFVERAPGRKHAALKGSS